MSQVERYEFVDQPTHFHVNTMNHSQNTASLYNTIQLQTQADSESQVRKKTPTSFQLFPSKTNRKRTKIQIQKNITLNIFKQVLKKIATQKQENNNEVFCKSNNYQIIDLFQSKPKLTYANSYQTVVSLTLEPKLSLFQNQQLIVWQGKIICQLNKSKEYKIKIIQNKQFLSNFIKSFEQQLKQAVKDISIDYQMSSRNEYPQSILQPTCQILQNQTKCYQAIEQSITTSTKQSFLSNILNKCQQLKKNPKSSPCSLIELVIMNTNSVFKQISSSFLKFDQDLIFYSIQRHLLLNTDLLILESYKEFAKQKDQIFQSKRDKLEDKTEEQCMIYLDIKPRYRLISNDKIPYQSAIDLLTQLNTAVTMRSRLFIIQSYYSQIKVNCYEHHRGKQEISTMDDILPVMIYTVLKCRVKSFYGILNMISDYIKTSGKFETDMRVLTNLFVGLQYISKQWKIQE